MKIGIMTLSWGRDNYGQFLQHYALQETLRKMGHEPFLIDYVSGKNKFSLLNKVKKSLLHPLRASSFVLDIIIKKCFFKHQRQQRINSFEQFRKKHFTVSDRHYSDIKELQTFPPAGDVYITGSDQVWNPFGNTARIAPFFLDFGSPDVKKVSYAASWGRTELSANEKNIIETLLKKFSAVTVREKSGIELCRQCGFTDAELVPDPTFLLDADSYRKIMKCPEGLDKNEKYILLYRLKHPDGFDYSKVFAFAKSKGLKVKYITGNLLIDFKTQIFPSIEEWLYLIDHAEYIITNSFHGTVFSILFKKQFATIPLAGKKAGMNQRLATVFEQLGMEPRYLNEFSILDTGYTANICKIQKESVTILGNIL